MVNYDVFRPELEDKESNKEEQLDVQFWCIFFTSDQVKGFGKPYYYFWVFFLLYIF